MFLKRIEMQGFKSFADKTVVNFNDQIIGIVGPNGCGKSNISDAVRWVLGEQSVKSLRGTAMSDIVFSGSEKRRSVNYAEVKLVFDNTDRVFALPFEEVEITRKINRVSSENEYYINQAACRLKDILELLMDTGVGRDSLSIISQGNIIGFAEAKPVDRRSFFEEAAGVAKYKRRKIESLAKLERTSDNLTRLQDIINEMDNQYQPLKRQAKRATEYLTKQKALQAIDVAVLVSDIERDNKLLKQLTDELFELEINAVMSETSISVHDHSIDQLKQRIKECDDNIQQQSSRLMSVMHELQLLEKQKVELEQKRKYVITTSNDEQLKEQLQQRFKATELELASLKQLNQQRQASLQLGNEQQINLKSEITKITDLQNNKYNWLRKHQAQQIYYQQMIKQPFQHQMGIKTIIDNNQLDGIYGVVASLVTPMTNFELAVETALGGSVNNIVTRDEACARNAINYLKRNEGGRATFLPLSVLAVKNLNRDVETIASSQAGYLGVASDYVTYSDELGIMVKALLGNVLVAKTLEDANQIARMIKYNNKIVTLDGDVVHRGGSMTGGKQKDSNSLLSARKQLNDLEQVIDTTQQEINQYTIKLTELNAQNDHLNQELMEIRLNLAQSSPLIEAKLAQLSNIKFELEQYKIDTNAITIDEVEGEMLDKLNKSYYLRDELTSKLSQLREQKISLQKEMESKEQSVRTTRRAFNDQRTQISQMKITETKLQIAISNNLERLASEYQMTFEYAASQVNETTEINRELAAQLRKEILAFGNVNLDAPTQFAELSERYEYLKQQNTDLVKAKDQLLGVINEMDELMAKQFTVMFERINKELPIIFTELFGGGHAKLVLDDDDVLNAGIDIDVQPPGKNVQNIRLFSGGEKSLIAICVLFAIMRVRPVPLCILDEAEAALDQANIERFGRYIQKYSLHTQFIVITHRVGTMTKCQSLYGVTMNQDGVSQLLRVQLKDAMKIAKEVE